MEWIWYIIAALGAGIGTGLAGLSAATVMVPVLIVLCPSFTGDTGAYLHTRTEAAGKAYRCCPRSAGRRGPRRLLLPSRAEASARRRRQKTKTAPGWPLPGPSRGLLPESAGPRRRERRG